MVKDWPHYAILRLGNITWGDNQHTLINTLRRKTKEGGLVEIQEATRYIIDREEFQHWVNLIPKWNCEMNLTGQPMTIREIMKEHVL